MNFRFLGKYIVPVLAVSLFGCLDVAAEVSVEASLTPTRIELGRAAQMKLRVEGSREVGRPPELNVDGLQTQFQGRSVQFQMINFDVRFITEFSYSIIPERAGKFTIPPLEIEAGGEVVNSEPLTLEVVATGGQRLPPAASSGTPQQQQDAPREQVARAGDLFFAELVVPKKSAYVGETIPAEVRMYFDTRIDFQIEGMPDFDSPNFTVKPMDEPRRDRVSLQGRTYDVVNFKCTLTPVKSGATELGPVKSDVLVRIPQPRQRSRDSFFEDFFNNSPFSRARTQRVRLATDPVEIEIKSLPEEGRPDSFAGAVGSFEMDVELSNNQTSIGSPLTVKAIISGKGDFDRVNAPVLTDNAGWRTYPPNSDFTPADVLGINGTKTFQLLAIPDDTKEQLPALEFSYFDPSEESYKIIRSEPVPIKVSGSPSASAVTQDAPAPGLTESPADNQAATAADTATIPPPLAGERDLLHIIVEPQQWGASFTPWYRKSSSWVWQLLVALALIATGIAGYLFKRGRNEKRLAQLARSKELAKLKAAASDSKADDFSRCKNFIDWLRLQTEACYDRAVALVDAKEAIAVRPGLADSVSQAVIQAFSRYDELSYSGQQRTTQVRSEDHSYETLIREIETHDAHKN